MGWFDELFQQPAFQQSGSHVGWSDQMEAADQFDPDFVARGVTVPCRFDVTVIDTVAPPTSQCFSLARHLLTMPQHNTKTADTPNCLKLIIFPHCLSMGPSKVGTRVRVHDSSPHLYSSVEMASTSCQNRATAPRTCYWIYPRETSFLFQRLSVAVRRFNAVCSPTHALSWPGPRRLRKPAAARLALFIYVFINRCSAPLGIKYQRQFNKNNNMRLTFETLTIPQCVCY